MSDLQILTALQAAHKILSAAQYECYKAADGPDSVVLKLIRVKTYLCNQQTEIMNAEGASA